jgi:excisionase family DNA binding protein
MTSIDESERLLTARELAELLGVSAHTVLDWCQFGEIPHFKINGRIRLRRSEVDAWLEKRHIEAAS